MFVQSAVFVEHHKKAVTDIAIYGQEKVAETIRLCKMNLAVHGLAGDIRQGVTYYEDIHKSVGKFDFVMANPPFNVDKVDKERLKDDPRYPFGLPKADNAKRVWPGVQGVPGDRRQDPFGDSAVDIAEVMAEIEALLDQSIGAEGYAMPPVADRNRYVDLSQIDFEALRDKFEGSRKTVEVQKLRAKLTFKLARMIQVNRTRIDFLEEFQRMIDEYNSGAINVQVFFDRLLLFAGRLDTEEKRGIAEQLTEEELVVFDLLTKTDIVLTDEEVAEVKKVAKSLLAKLKQEKLVLDWRKQQTTRAMVFTTIKDILDELPRAYSKEVYERKCDAVYQHFYESYMGQGKSLYAVN
jgi:restriction endonuclease HindI-like protein/N-6 DNA methylase